MAKTTKQLTTRTQVRNEIRKLVDLKEQIDNLKTKAEEHSDRLKDYMDENGLTEIRFKTGESAELVIPVRQSFDYEAVEELLRSRVTRGALRGTLRDRLLATAFKKLTRRDMVQVIKTVSKEVGKSTGLTNEVLQEAIVSEEGARRFYVAVED